MKWLNNLIEMICTILNDNITSTSWKDPPEPEARPAHLKEYNGFFSEKSLDITINLEELPQCYLFSQSHT